MTYQAYNRANLEEAGKAGGELINMVVKKERQFWIYLKKNTSNYTYTRIKFLIILFISAIFEIIFRGVFTLIFGPLWPVSFPLGFIKLVTYTCLGYIIGFEGAVMYSKLIETATIYCDKELYDKILNSARTKIIQMPVKKRSLSETNLNPSDDCNGKFCECEGIFNCDKKDTKEE